MHAYCRDVFVGIISRTSLQRPIWNTKKTNDY